MAGVLNSPEGLYAFYKSQLDNSIAFWMEHGLDREQGGYNTFLNQEGQPYSYFKYTWCQGRMAYQFSKLYNSLECRPEWLEAARLGVDFIKNHALRKGDRVYSKFTREGQPIAWQDDQVFPEAFVVLGLAEWAKASGDDEALAIAERIFWNALRLMRDGGLNPFGPEIQPYYRWHGPSMIMLNVAQELREINHDPRLDPVISSWVEDELFLYTKDEHRIMFERVRPDGSLDLQSHEGRSITPGHVEESAWFCLREGLERGDKRLIDRACDVALWGMEKGWDQDFGGLNNFVDFYGGPCGHHDEGWGEDQDWDEKLFWVHAEALYSVLLAYHTSCPDGSAPNPERYANLALWYEKLHAWTFSHFPDQKYGEWYGYLHRDGSLSQSLKGGVKGFFHIPRALLNCTLLLASKAPGAHGPLTSR
jgi:N-acylglucosamine 2-epimerase